MTNLCAIVHFCRFLQVFNDLNLLIGHYVYTIWRRKQKYHLVHPINRTAPHLPNAQHKNQLLYTLNCRAGLKLELLTCAEVDVCAYLRRPQASLDSSSFIWPSRTWDGVVHTVTRLPAVSPRTVFRFPVRARDLFPVQNFQTVSGTQPASYSMGAGVSF
jgi:hypothetical protein